MANSAPIISVIMAVHNGERFLVDAVDSILSQTLVDFEFIVIDDGSTDQTKLILENYAEKDSRIRLIARENRGLTKSLNEGLDLARGEFIARMDADDVSLPNRLEVQFNYLVNNPLIGLVSANMDVMDENMRITGEYAVPKTYADVLWWSMFQNPFAHPAVMLRHSVLTRLDLKYDESFQTSQDFDLWERVIQSSPAENVSETLVLYRRHPFTVQKRFRENQIQSNQKIRCRAFVNNCKRYGIAIADDEVASGNFLVGRNTSTHDYKKNRLRFSILLSVLHRIRDGLKLDIKNRWVRNGYLELTNRYMHLISMPIYLKFLRDLSLRDGAKLTIRLAHRCFPVRKPLRWRALFLNKLR